MINTLQRVVAKLNRKKTDGERGFSLIELIIVVVIIGVLVGIAIPIYNNIQNTAKQNAVKAAAANGASQAVAQIANGQAVSLTNLVTGSITSVAVSKGTTTDTVCVSASDGSNTFYAGPGANSAGTGCN